MIDASVVQGQRSTDDTKRSSVLKNRRGGILAWLAMCFLLVAVGVVVCGIFVARSIKVHETNGKDVRVDTPFGSVHVQNHDNGQPESAGMPLYPGAKPRRHGESASIDLSEIFGNNDLHIVAGKWQTPDPIAKVQKFYKSKFPEMSVIQHDGKVEMHSVEGHAKRVIVLRRIGDDNATEISLASVGEPKAN